MISQVRGTVIAKELDRTEVLTPGGVAYELAIPLSAYEALPGPGEHVTVHTHLVVRDDGWQLFGFSTPYDRQVFRAVLGAKGVGPTLALSLLSALSAERLVRALRERDIVTLQRVPRVGRKKAEQLVLDLADKVDALVGGAGAGGAAGGLQGAPPGVEDAVLGLVRLGYGRPDAERAVRAALDAGATGHSVPDLVRAALTRIAGR